MKRKIKLKYSGAIIATCKPALKVVPKSSLLLLDILSFLYEKIFGKNKCVCVSPEVMGEI
jgi:hypothetical protein